MSHISKYVLSDILICGECSHPYRRQTWSRNGTLTPVWRCGSRLKSGTKICKNSPTLKEKPLQQAIMTAVNDVAENRRKVIGAFRENVIRVIGNHTTKNIKSEFDEDLIRRLILRIKAISESKIEIQFKHGIVMEQEVPFYDD